MTAVDFARWFRALPGRFVVVDAAGDHRVVAASAAFDAGTDVVGLPLREAFPPGAPSFEAALLRVTQQGVCEVMPIHSYDVGDGERRWWKVVHSPVLDDEGFVSHVVVRVDDVTTISRWADDVTARAEAVAHIGSWWLDVERGVSCWSDEALRIFGIDKRTTLTPEVWLPRVLAADRARVEASMAAVAADLPIDLTYRIVVDGEVRFVRARFEARRDDSGNRVGTVQDVTDLERALQAERDSDAQLRDLFDVALDAIFVADRDGKNVDANAAACALVGYDRDELLSMRGEALIAPDDRHRQSDLLARLDAGDSSRDEWRLLRKDGSTVPVELSVTRTSNGRFLGLARDISARRAAAAALTVSEERCASIIGQSADAIVSVDVHQRVVLWNAAATRIFGWSAGEIVGQPLTVLLPERFAQVHTDHVTAFAGAGGASRPMGARDMPLFGRRKNGEEFPAAASISAVHLADGPVMTATVRDITAEQRADRRTRFLLDVGETLGGSLDIDAVADHIVALAARLGEQCLLRLIADDDDDHRPVIVVGRGVAADALRGLPIELFCPRRPVRPSQRKVVVQPVAALSPLCNDAQRELLQRLGVTAVLQVPLLFHERWLGALAVVVTGDARSDADVELLGGLADRAAVAVENALLFAARKKAIDARDSVLGLVAHDLRSPLQTIALAVDELRAGVSVGVAERVGRAAQRMTGLITDLLDVTRAEGGALTMSCAPVQPTEVLSEVLQMEEGLAAARRLALVNDAVDDAPAVWVDRGRLLQVFDNLIGNALKSTAPGGRITIGAARDGDFVRFHVDDTGSGIPPASLPHLFDRFWQAHRGDRAGAGLGLAIVKGIVESLGGAVTVSSTLGVGTSFCFTVPLAH